MEGLLLAAGAGRRMGTPKALVSDDSRVVAAPWPGQPRRGRLRPGHGGARGRDGGEPGAPRVDDRAVSGRGRRGLGRGHGCLAPGRAALTGRLVRPSSRGLPGRPSRPGPGGGRPWWWRPATGRRRWPRSVVRRDAWTPGAPRPRPLGGRGRDRPRRPWGTRLPGRRLTRSPSSSVPTSPPARTSTPGRERPTGTPGRWLWKCLNCNHLTGDYPAQAAASNHRPTGPPVAWRTWSRRLPPRCPPCSGGPATSATTSSPPSPT